MDVLGPAGARDGHVIGEPMRIAIIGAGAVGGYCAAHLARAGHEVHVVDQGEHLAAIQARGLRVRTPQSEWSIRLPATGEPRAIGEVDLVIVAVQSQQTEDVARGIRPLIGSNTIVLPLQNNVDNPERLAAVLDGDHVLAATLFIASSRPEPGLIHQLAEQVKIYIGERDGQVSDRVQALVPVFNDAQLPCESTSAIRREMWIKFTFVVGFYLTAPLRTPARHILELEETRTLHRRLLAEVAAVAAANGIPLSEGDLTGMVETTRFYGDYLPSSVQEMDEGRADEAEHMLRTVIHMAQENSVATPTAETVLAFTRFLNQRNKRLATAG